jgi:hypothetical protein
MAADQGRDGGGLSSGARLGLVVAAVVVLVAAFVIVRGGDDDGSDGSGTQATTTQTETNADSQTTPDHSGRGDETETETETHTQTQTQTQPPADPVRTVRVEGSQPVGGVKTLTYRNGDRIRLRVVADAADEVHVHGFDIEREVSPSEPARFDFKADIEGRFEVELHSSDTQIALLEVRPAS